MRLGGEDGAALLLALAFLVFFGLVITVVLGFAEASVRKTTNLREQRAIVYVADGATDAAIQYARVNTAVGAFGAVPCMSVDPYTVTLNGRTATVTCISVGNPLSPDRRVVFTASVDGLNRVRADVFYRAGGAAPDVLSWTYQR